MRTNTLGFVFGTESRVRIAKAIFEHPKRKWSCSAIEDVTKLPHTTVFRALKGLHGLSLLRSTKINRKDIVYELAESPLSKDIEKTLSLEKNAVRDIACKFTLSIKERISSALLYGSYVKNTQKPGSDIDILVIVPKPENMAERFILDKATELSVRFNKTLSVVIMGAKEIKRESKGQFIKSVKESMEVLYGKAPF